MTSRHAFCSPSGAAAWMACPSWKSEETSSPVAALGSAIHLLAELALRSNQVATDFLGVEITEGFIVDEDMARVADSYISIVREVSQDADHSWVERQVSITPVTGEPNAFGTADAVVIQGNELIVIDLKTGAREVSAENNTQLSIYAAALLDELELYAEFDSVRLMIVQPTIYRVSEWVTTPAHIREVQAEVQAAAAIRMSGGGAPFANATSCRFCARRGTCATYAESALSAVADSPVDLRKPIAPQIDSAIERLVNSDAAHLAECFSVIKFVREWTYAVEELCVAEAMAGRPLRGFKLVAGRSTPRKWRNADEAVKTLAQAGVDNDLILKTDVQSPTQVAKSLKGTEFESLVQELSFSEPGKPTLVPESDRRPSISTSDVFENLQ